MTELVAIQRSCAPQERVFNPLERNSPPSSMAANVDPPKKPCHNCRRQRLRCDRSYPRCNKCVLAGRECLGYGQLFRWTGSVASRGKFAGKTSLASGEDEPGAETYRESPGPQSSSESWTLSSGAPSPSGGDHNLQLVHAMSTPADEVAGPWTLTDPLFQDLSQPYRYYLSYCEYICALLGECRGLADILQSPHEFARILSHMTCRTTTPSGLFFL